MNIYLLVSFIVFVLIGGSIDLVYKKNSKIFLISICIFFAIIVASRSVNIVPDTLGYLTAYLSLDTFTFYTSETAPSGFELGFIYLSELIKMFAGPYYFIYFLFITIINLIIIVFSLKNIFETNLKYSNIFVAIAIYISYYGFYYNAIVLRAGIAISIILLAASLALKKKWLVSISLVLLAITFHQSAIIGLVILLILKLKIRFSKKKYFIIWLVIGIVLFSKIGTHFMLDIILYLLNYFPEYNVYIRTLSFSTTLTSWNIFYYLLGGLFLTYSKKNDRYYNILNVYYIGILLVALVPGMNILYRMLDYFIVFNFILFHMYILDKKLYITKFLLFSLYFLSNLYAVIKITGISP
ncbi:EpsG family protein [Bacillus infantis]|uniref:EpsG family protein n=1 Tax=Bacillus infantis TaxID=324767 RepID=UPI003CF05BCF